MSGSATPSANPSPSGSGTGSGSAAAEPGLQRALAAEQQAAFGFALLGPHVPAQRTDDVRGAQALHEALRDRVAGLVAADGAAPVAPLGDYPALYPYLAHPLLLAARLEDDCTAAWRYAFAAAANPAGRRLPQQQLIAAAVRATRWRLLDGAATAVTAFPGIS